MNKKRMVLMEQIAIILIANVENMQDTTCRYSIEEQSLSQTLLSPRIFVP